MQATLLGTGSGTVGASSVAASATPVVGKLHLALIIGADATARNVTAVTGCGLTWTLVGPAGGGGSSTLDIGSTVAVFKGTGTPTAGTVTATFSGAISYARLAVVDILDSPDVVASNVQTIKISGTQLILSFNPFDDPDNRSIAAWGAYKVGAVTSNTLSFGNNTLQNFGRDAFGPNLLTPNQSSMETDASGWARDNTILNAPGNDFYLQGIASGSIPLIGAQCLEVRSYGVPYIAWGYVTVPFTTVPVTVGRTYSASAWIRSFWGSIFGQASIYWYNSGGTKLSQSDGAIVGLSGGSPNGATGWQQCTAVGVAPATAAYAVVGLYGQEGGDWWVVGTSLPYPGRSMYIDSVELREANKYVYSGVSWEPDVLDLTMDASITGESANTYWGVAIELAAASAASKTNWSTPDTETTWNPGIIASTLPKVTQAALVAVSSPAGTSGTIVSTLPKLTQAATLRRTTAFSTVASATTLSGGPVTGTITTPLPKLVTAATAASSSSATTGTIVASLPHLVTAATASGGVREESGWVTVTGSTSTTATATVSNVLPKLTQAIGVVTGSAPAGSITSTLPSLRQDVTATVGTVTSATGTVTQTLPKLSTAAILFYGPVPTATGPINTVLPSLRQNVTTLVASLPPPPTQTGVEGLVHIFQKGALSRSLPATNSPLQVVGEFRDRASMVGGFQSATGSISPDEYNAHPQVYSVGATWLVKSLALEAAGLPPYIFGGELKQPQSSEGVVTLAADGWGLLQERQVERFLLASMAVDQWAPGDERPFNFNSSARMVAEVKGQRLVFSIEHDKSFKRNDAGQPNVWRSAPLVFWAPKMNLRWIKFTIKATGRNINPYDLELVGTPTGPTGNLTVLRSWNLNNQNTDATFQFQIPDGYDLIGLRMIRSTEAKKPPHARVVVDDVIVGALAANQPFTLNEAFTTLFSFMGANTTQIETATDDILPYDASRVSLAEVADDLAVLGEWYWRLWANAAGGKQGEAGSIGDRDWQVQLVHTPIRLLPQVRYNVVQFDYKYGGGYTSQDTVRANPDPYPGTDVVYVLDLPEPPVFVLAQRFAQKIANLVSKPWFSGSGTLFKVNPGNQPAAVVKPGDKLTLLNYGSAQVIVDEITHSEDGNLVEAQFAEASKIVDRWLALWQQKINQGLSPNGATLALLDAAEPRPPTITAGFTMSQKREGRKDYDLVVTSSLVTEDIEDNGTFVSRYEFRARPIDPQTGNPISAGQGGGWRERHVRAPRDDEVEETKTAVFEKINNPKKWAWEVQGWAVDALGQKSTRDSEFPGKPADFVPVTPQSVSLDVDQRVMTVTHVIPPDPDDPTEEDQTYDHAIIRINDQNGNWTSPLKQDRKVKGEHKRFRFHKPIDNQTYYAQVTYVDFWGNKSTPVVVSNSKRIPPQPVIGICSFDAKGTRHARFRLQVPVTANDSGHDDNVKRILVQMCHKNTNATPVVGDKKVRDYVRVGDDPQEALFRNIPKGDFVFVRGMSVDSDQKESGFTSWVSLGKPKDFGLTDAPATPTWLGVSGQLQVAITAPRRIVVDWDDPDDDDAVRWRVIIRRGATTMEDRTVRNTRAVYRVPQADVGATHTAQVYAINYLGVSSAPTSQITAIPIADVTGAGVGNPPNVPSNPSFVTDGRGSRHAKYRVIVTAGTSTTDGTHDAPHAYIIQLAHDVTDSGANPPAGSKRQHGRVEGDATGDDLQEVFRSIPKRHFLWVRERARNAAGASAWTGWRTASRSIDFGVAVAPNPPTGVTVDTAAPRRVVVDWNDPDDDETVRWRVEIRRGGSTVKTGFTRSTRYVYRVPKAFANVIHNARVFAISDTGTDSSQVDSPDGTPLDDDFGEGHVVGDIVPKAHGAAPPANWLLCNGQLVPTSAWPALFTLYGYSHGGSGTQFGVPDIRGRHPAGVGTNITVSGVNSDEGDAEVNRSSVNVIDPDGTYATPIDDGTLAQPLDGNQFEQTHTHSYGGDDTGGPSTTTQVNSTGQQGVAGPAHSHNLSGRTSGSGTQHGHQHGHGNHPHPHGHGSHPHPHPHNPKKRAHKGMHWIVKAA